MKDAMFGLAWGLGVIALVLTIIIEMRILGAMH